MHLARAWRGKHDGRTAPLMQPKSAAFWDRVARRYARMAIRNPAGYEATIDAVRSHLQPTDHVFELGCGTGTTALKLAPSVAGFVACDYSAEMIAIANEKLAAETHSNLEFSVGASGDDTLPAGPFDAALAFNVLHLLPDRPVALTEVFNRLRSGGLFISKTPCLSGYYRIFQPLIAVLHIFGKAPHFHFLTPAKLEQEIRDAGFRIVERNDTVSTSRRRFILAQKA